MNQTNIYEFNKEEMDALEKMSIEINDALLKVYQNHYQEFNCKSVSMCMLCETVLMKLIESGHYNDKTYTVHFPTGTVTFKAKVGAPND